MMMSTSSSIKDYLSVVEVAGRRRHGNKERRCTSCEQKNDISYNSGRNTFCLSVGIILAITGIHLKMKTSVRINQNPSRALLALSRAISRSLAISRVALAISRDIPYFFPKPAITH